MVSVGLVGVVSVGVDTGVVTFALVREGALADVVVTTATDGTPCVVEEVICRGSYTLEFDSVTNLASVGFVPSEGVGVVEWDSCAAPGPGAGNLDGCTLYR